MRSIIKPRGLKKGDTIGIISPAGAVRDVAQFENAVNYFQLKGYNVKISEHSRAQKRYLAGSDSERLYDLETFFYDEEVDAIICSRGGYGTVRILDKLDFDLIRLNPKIFVGYSDITSLLVNFVEQSGVVTFHGPLALSDFGSKNIDEFTERNFFSILEGNFAGKFENSRSYTPVCKGKAEGTLVGGNLAVLASLCGTPYFPDLKGKILFLEDVSEPLYKIDRMFSQLRLAGVLTGVKGIILGDFTGLDEDTSVLADLAVESFSALDVPVGLGFAIGHERQKLTLPLGVKYSFDADAGILQIEESYLS